MVSSNATPSNDFDHCEASSEGKIESITNVLGKALYTYLDKAKQGRLARSRVEGLRSVS